MGERLTDVFMSLFCEKNSDGTRNLRLKGKDMFQRIGVRIDNNDMLKISSFLADNLMIVKLDLCYNDIGDRGLATLVDNYLCEPNVLEYLNLVGCNITSIGMERLALAFETLRLKTLRVNGNKIKDEGGRFAAMLLERNDTIQHLDVGDCDLTIASVMYFMSILRNDIGGNRTLKVFDISRIIPNSMMYQYNPELIGKAVGEMLKVNNTLVEMHIQKCEMDGHDVECLLLGLQYNKTLLLLDLGYNKIGDHGLELLAKWLRTRPSLLGLNVAGNGIKNSGARALSFGMPFSRLRMLDISNNHVEDGGLVDILHSIKKPCIMRLLFMWGNTFGAESRRLIQRMIKSQVLEQENIDVKIYEVDGVLWSAFYPADHYKHKYYCVMDYGCPVELRIKRNRIDHERAQPKAKIQFQFYPRIPPVDPNLPPYPDPCGSKQFEVVGDEYLGEQELLGEQDFAGANYAGQSAIASYYAEEF